jgi:hypothetical protein
MSLIFTSAICLPSGRAQNSIGTPFAIALASDPRHLLYRPTHKSPDSPAALGRHANPLEDIKQIEQDDDRNGDADQPKKYSTHLSTPLSSPISLQRPIPLIVAPRRVYFSLLIFLNRDVRTHVRAGQILFP